MVGPGVVLPIAVNPLDILSPWRQFP